MMICPAVTPAAAILPWHRQLGFHRQNNERGMNISESILWFVNTNRVKLLFSYLLQIETKFIS